MTDPQSNAYKQNIEKPMYASLAMLSKVLLELRIPESSTFTNEGIMFLKEYDKIF